MESGTTIGFDPGTAQLGYGVLQEEDPLAVVAFGVLQTTPADPMPVRLLQLYEGVREILDHYHPQIVVVEQLFFARNVTTALTVGQARGVVLLAAAQAHVPVTEYTPAQVKQAVAGYGKATKAQMQEMVRMQLCLDATPQPDDAADALAIALCHLHFDRFRRTVSAQS